MKLAIVSRLKFLFSRPFFLLECGRGGGGGGGGGGGEGGGFLVAAAQETAIFNQCSTWRPHVQL